MASLSHNGLNWAIAYAKTNHIYPSVSVDPGSLYRGSRQSSALAWWDPGIRTNTRAGDTVETYPICFIPDRFLESLCNSHCAAAWSEHWRQSRSLRKDRETEKIHNHNYYYFYIDFYYNYFFFYFYYYHYYLLLLLPLFVYLNDSQSK